jgi:hypothetical protein
VVRDRAKRRPGRLQYLRGRDSVAVAGRWSVAELRSSAPDALRVLHPERFSQTTLDIVLTLIIVSIEISEKHSTVNPNAINDDPDFPFRPAHV